MMTKKTEKPRSPDFHLTVTFHNQARSLRHRPHRTFYLIDELGRPHCL